MKLAFIDLTTIDYTPLTPETVPLGGMQSGLCYLSTALGKRGHDVTLFNGSSCEGVFASVKLRNFKEFCRSDLSSFDAFISISCQSGAIRPYIQDKPLILFTGHNNDEPSMKALLDPEERDAWDHFVFKSNWQAETVGRRYSLDAEKITILTNAAAPCFTETEGRQTYFFEKRTPPVLYYSSTPFRGLSILADAFPTIRKAIPGVRAIIYSSMKPYHSLATDDPYSGHYERCRKVGMEYVGGLGQVALAQAIRSADILAFPSNYPETSCITVMEGMLNSSLIITRSLGALPETCAGYGLMLPERAAQNGASLPALYSDFVIKIVNMAYSDPVGLRRHLTAQREYALKNYSWAPRAAEWEEFVACACRNKAGGHLPVAVPRQSPVYNYVRNAEGMKLYFDPRDERGRRLGITGGSLNPVTQQLWRKALCSDNWDMVVDVGANYGEMLLDREVLACPRILAVEPSPRILPYLRTTLSPYANVRVAGIALSGEAGMSELAMHKGWSGFSRLGKDAGHEFDRVEVEVMTLDNLVAAETADDGRPLKVLLKIDVEGGEIGVLQGAVTTMRNAGSFCALIEIEHQTDANHAYIEQTFDIYALNIREDSVEKIDSIADLKGMGPQYWTQDVVIKRKGDQFLLT